MSVDAGITFRLIAKDGPRAALDALLDSQWHGDEDGWWCIPLGEDASEWRLIHGADRRNVVELAHAKMDAGEVFGIRMWWGDSEIGGNFLIFPSSDVLFSPTINRVKLGPRTTDVSWYLSRLVTIFTQRADVELESWVWSETC